MQVVNYISNISPEEASGGWSGMNYHVQKQLAKRVSLNSVLPVNPAFSMFEKVVSKIRRTIGKTGSFPAFTSSRLQQIADTVAKRTDPRATFNFFHGATPWINFASPVPYALYLDACFATYIDVYHDRRLFDQRQLDEICKKEISFLERAQSVFFSSAWAMADAKRRYGISGENFIIAGLGGFLDNDSNDVVTDRQAYFLFVGLDFAGKGGDKLVNAFKKIQVQYPEYKLKIAGQRPGPAYLDNPGVEYAGYFNKGNPAEFEQLTKLFKGASAFVLPTSRDMTPLVIIEAGSVGCPVISIKNFGIPEMVKDGETGILIDPAADIEAELEKAMLLLVKDKDLRRKMSEASRLFTAAHFNWDRTGGIIFDAINK